jgi:hypothetical protein
MKMLDTMTHTKMLRPPTTTNHHHDYLPVMEQNTKQSVMNQHFPPNHQHFERSTHHRHDLD